LANNGYLKAKPTRVRKKKETAPAYQTLFSPDGFPVYFGKNNIQNEYVTFKKARKQNLWFHVKDMHGSHVILDCENPSEADIRYCAQVAAFFSDARESGSIPVNWCEVRNLKKIPGGKTGTVTMSGYQTIYIDISDDTKAALSGR
ncbi:MAG: DUF814 domain-containing protein, partial [Erysipelotrichaceae bacterium]|nr:DUF814 domain-containing protein [Erysipelotrichaceae bacterium]